jgi:hypothetical protein
MWLENCEVQVCWPLRDQYEPESASGIPEISVSYAWILSSVRHPDAHIGNEAWIWRNDLVLLHEWRTSVGRCEHFAQKFPPTRISEREPTLERLRSSLEVL